MNKQNSESLFSLSKRLFHIAAPVKKELTISTLASIVGNLSQMGVMGFGATLLLASGHSLPEGLARPALILLFISALLIVLCRYTEGVVSHAGAYRLLAKMRIDLFVKLRVLAPACLMDENKGEILNLAVADIETIEFFFAHTIGPMITVVLLPCITLSLAFSFDPLLALALLPVYLLVSIVFPLTAVKAGEKIGQRYRRGLGKMKAFILESVYGLKDIQIFSYGAKRRKEMEELNRSINQASHWMILHRQIVASVPSFFIYLARILIVGTASWLALQGRAEAWQAVILSCVAAASFSSTQSLTTVVSSLLETYAAARRLFALEDETPAVKESVNPVVLSKITDITFDHVSFSYQPDSPQILNDLSLTLNKQDKLGIAGESGAGKSTILRLLLRFWETSGGTIRINGIKLEDISLSSLHERIALLEQDTFLFNATLAENIALAKPGASLKEIQTAAKRAGLHDFIMTLPEGYNTPMGSMSSRLSGGERQRVGIARMMLLDPDVLIMDEPTSALDILHEKELLETLRTQMKDKIVILVSHRSSTLSICKRRMKLIEGKLIEENSAVTA